MKNRGFTLIEIVVATIILSVLAAGFFAIFFSSRKLVERSKVRLVASEVARQEIERMRQYIRADLWFLGNASDPLNPTGCWSAWDSTRYQDYSFRYKVDAGPGSADYRIVSVEAKCNY